MRRLMMMFQASPRQLAQQRLFEAERAAVTHTCQAQYHSAMADMARDQAAAMRKIVDGDDVDPRVTLPPLEQ